MTDYISREAAYKTLTEYYHHTTDGMHLALKEALSRVPAADVRENKRGKWISVFDDETIIPIKDGAPQGCCYCSVCGDLLVASDEYEVKGNFCPNCGADMREGDA